VAHVGADCTAADGRHATIEAGKLVKSLALRL
jgi:hypothetical protein